MFRRKKAAGDEVTPPNAVQAKDPFEQENNWEASRTQAIEKSEQRAWYVAYGAVGVAVLSWLAIVLMMPLKETIPYVIRVDNTTGVPDIVTALNSKGVGYEEVMDKYWLAQFVRARETYDWYTLQKDYNTVGLLASPNVGKDYAALFEGPEALDKKFGKSVRATVEIVSVVPNGRGVGTVRFIKTTKRTDDDGPGTVTKWVATVAYEYRNPSLISESQRLVNPFGFQVLSYRQDPEMVGGGQ
nr:TraJ protein [uncultured bacterium]